MTEWYRWDGTDLVLTLRIQPRASRDEMSGPLGGAYKVKITAPPVDGKANVHLRAFLATSFGVAKSQVKIESGESGRHKRVRIANPNRIPISQIRR